MNVVFALAIVGCVMGLVACDDHPLDDDDVCGIPGRFCDRNECCIPHENSLDGAGRCRDIGDDWGDLCGPPAYCDCDLRYECIPHNSETIRVRRLASWQINSSNGTCEPTAETRRRWDLRRSRRPTWRRRYDDDDSDDDDDDDDFDDDRRRRRR